MVNPPRAATAAAANATEAGTLNTEILQSLVIRVNNLEQVQAQAQ